MARRSANYWQRRAEARLIAIERGTEPYLRRIYQLNLGVVDSIREDIERIIGSFAKHSQLTREEAISLLGETITEVERQRIIAMCSGIEDKATKARLMAKVNAPAYRARIDRLLAIEVSAQAKMALLAPRQIDTMTSGLHKAGMEMYSRTMFDLQRGTGLGFSFAGVTDKQIESVMRETWSGGHYSSRVWRNTQIVAERIRDTVERNMITGRSWRRSLNTVADQALIDSNYAASRIMRTETAYVANEMEALAYEEAGLDEYRYVATLDGRTSEVCKELDGKKFKLKDRETGKNYPPMHPHCRSTTVAVIEGLDMTELQRRAKDLETGEVRNMPAEMNYGTWTAYTDKIKVEPPITADIKDIANDLGVPLAGLEHRIKTPKSFTRKAKSDAAKLKVSQAQAASNISDAVRYTALFDGDTFLAQYTDFKDALDRKDIEILRIKNTFRHGEPYKGINVKARTKEGAEFEIQFHTEESYSIKENKLRELYDKYRDDSTSREEAERLREQMIAISDTIKLPREVEKIG